MITFEDHGSKVVLVYFPAYGPVKWLDDKLDSDGHATLSQVFTVQKTDLLSQDADGEDDEGNEDIRRFVIGSHEGEYRTIRSDVLGLKHDLLIVTTMLLTRSTFIAERNISIFGRIDDLLTEQIVVGGNRAGAIPVEEFARLLRRFPTSTEVNYYAATRVTRILREYLETMSDAELRLENYIKRRERAETEEGVEAHGRIMVANELELEKFTYVRERLVEMLKDAEGYSEAEWQRAVADLFLLVFPQYIAVLHHVHVKERYSNESKSTDRYIDLMLVGSNGCVDIIELKKPFERGLMSKTQYRDNHVPMRELSGSIMQAEKYLFYLSKLGRDGEKVITEKHAVNLPPGLEIKIANPKAIILTGRDSNLSTEERFDFEFVRRKYSNVVDIISYDDLLRRLENVIATLTKRVVTEDNLGPVDEIGVSA
ncbi:Shedu immune nuclease family protein [Pseudarthrobacter sp. NPDC092184]|uniref:Shedu immune nuclease family protein n=1 Tax=unclassified Pseudarthrobacter TaxID=2647000 RepID=UPI0037F4629C